MSHLAANLEASISDRYLLVESVAVRRGMQAWRGYDRRREEEVFVKGRDRAWDPYATVRIANEADITASLDHPQIPGYRDAEPDAESPYIVTDFAESTPGIFSSFEDSGNMRLAVAVVRSALEPLEYVHESGIAHCDVKPGNLLAAQEDTTLADFDIAVRIGGQAVNQLLGEDSEMGLATLAYASPEKLADIDELDGRSDIYSMGQVLLHFLSGTHPLTAKDPNDLVIKRQLFGNRPRGFYERELPAELMAIVDRALQYMPDDRYQSAAEMAEELDRWMHDSASAQEAELTRA